MQVYLYNPENGEFVREEMAAPSPAEEGKFLYPAFSTTLPPPRVKEGEIAGYSGGTWTVRRIQRSPERTPQTARAEKLADIKGKAAGMLAAEDATVQRHREQIDLGGNTSLSTDEYLSLLARRQAIRNRSNQYERDLANIPDVVPMIDDMAITYGGDLGGI